MQYPTSVLAAFAFAIPTAAAQSLIDEVPAKDHFAGRPTFHSFRYPLAGDFDRDRDLDLVVSVVGVGLRFYANDGSAAFTDASTGRFPRTSQEITGMVAGDVDRDGDLDVVLGTEGQTLLLLNSGSGVFVSAVSTAVPPDSATTAIASGDLDGDGDLDLVRASVPNVPIPVYFNDGRGVFRAGPAAQPVMPSPCNVLRLADVDGDRDLDLIANGLNGSTRLLVNNGAGVFTDVTATQVPAIASAADLAVADVDRDGDFDLILGMAAYAVPGQNRLLLNDGRGFFTDATQGRLPVHLEVHRGLAAFDIDADGDTDLLWGALPLPRLALNDGSGRFIEVPWAELERGGPTRPQVQAAAMVMGPVAADFDNDGDFDVVCTSMPPRQLRLLLNVGGGRLVDLDAGPTPQRIGDAMSLALGDVDGDGRLDVVAGYGRGAYATISQDLANRLLLGDGHGRFTEAPTGWMPAGTDDTRVVLLGDVDRDGDLDVFFGNSTTQSRLLLNDGRGRFTDVTQTHVLAPIAAVAAVFVDIDRDGDLDLFAGNLSQTFVLQNDGTGRLSDVTRSALPSLPDSVSAVAAADVDGDADPDLVLAGRGASLFLNNGSGRFVAGSLPAGLRGAAVTFADVDGDRDPDLVMNGCVMGINDGRGGFQVDWSRMPSCPGTEIAALDLDADGDLDFLLGTSLGIHAFVNDGRGFFTDATALVVGAILQGAVDLVPADVDGDQDVDVITASSGYFSCRILHNRARHLATPWAARTGRPYRLDVFGWAGIAPTSQIALPLLSPGVQTPPLNLGVWGRLNLALPSLFALTPVLLRAPAGAASVGFTLPNAPALIGATIHAQALVLHAASPTAWRLTNLTSDRVLQ